MYTNCHCLLCAGDGMLSVSYPINLHLFSGNATSILNYPNKIELTHELPFTCDLSQGGYLVKLTSLSARGREGRPRENPSASTTTVLLLCNLVHPQLTDRGSCEPILAPMNVQGSNPRAPSIWVPITNGFKDRRLVTTLATAATGDSFFETNPHYFDWLAYSIQIVPASSVYFQ